MGKLLLKVLRWFLIGWGAVSLVGIAVLAFFAIGPGNRDRQGSAELKDVQFVLEWCGLGRDRAVQVVNSYESARSPMDDHVDGYAIRISRVEIAELLVADAAGRRQWFRGDELPPTVDSAVEFASEWARGELEWFPGSAELRSSKMYVYPVTITFHGVSPDATELVFVRPEDKMVFYFSGRI